MKPLKVLHVINSLVAAGAEKLLLDALPYYEKKGIKNELLLLDHKDTDLYLKARDLSDLVIHRPNHKISFYSPRHVLILRKYLRDFDIIHVHLFPAIYWVALADIFLFKARKYKLVVTEHSSDNRRRNKPIFRFMERILYRRYDRIITIAAPARISLQKHLGRRFNEIDVIENGIDLQLIETAEAYTKNEIGESEESYLIMQVSGFRPPKDQETVIKSLLHLPDDVKLLLVGDGPTIHEHKALTAHLKLGDRVRFLGIRNDVPRLLKTCDVIVLASHFEGLSLASIEGLASGKPFIASDVKGLKEVVEGHGLVFPDSDDRALAYLIQKLRSDEGYAAEVVRQCKKRSVQFSIDKMTDGYIEVYRSLTSK